MTNPLASPWIPLVVLIGLVLATRLIQRNWLAPSVFTPLLWSVYLFLPLCVASEYRVSALGTWIIVLLVGCMVLGAVLAEGRASDKSLNLSFTPSAMRSILRWTVLLSALSFTGALCAAAIAVRDYGLDFSASGLLVVGHLLSVERYSGQQTPFLVRVLVTWVFPAALLGGMSYANARVRWERLLCFIPILSAFAFSIVQAAKAMTLISAVLGISGYVAMRITQNRLTASFVPRRILLLAGAVLAVGVSFFFAIDALRTHEKNDEEVKLAIDWDRAKSTAFGYLPVFSRWADESEGLFYFAGGQYTFGGLLEAAGLHVRHLGIYTEMVSLDAANDDSNIYTAFRGLVEDFSLPGALVVCVLGGYIAGNAYRKRSSCRASYTVVLSAFYSFVIWSPIGSVFVYNGPILALLVAAFALKRAFSDSGFSALPA